MSTTTNCFLCGIRMIKERKCRYKSTSELQAFVRDRCVPTPIAHQRITEAGDLPDQVPVCIPCVNWKRRASVAGRGKHYLQVDQLVMYILQPGRMAELDQRCVGRLLDALAEPTSPFAASIPLPVRAILARLDAHDLQSITKSWWEQNGYTRFFRHPQTARLVRSLHKDADEHVEDE